MLFLDDGSCGGGEWVFGGFLRGHDADGRHFFDRVEVCPRACFIAGLRLGEGVDVFGNLFF